MTAFPNSDVLQKSDSQLLWHPYTSLLESEPPLVVVEAQDEFLTLADGRRIIDGIASWWTSLHGHRHPILMKALTDAAAKLDHVHFAGVTHPYAIELAEQMLATMPWTNGRVFFSDNGSTAVEVALKMAYQYWCHRGEPRRTLFVSFDGAYHGDTVGAMSVSRHRFFSSVFEPLLFEAEQVPLDPNQLNEFLQKRGEHVPAVIIEPLVQGAGGMRMHTPEVLRDIFEVCRRHGVLFIADEVLTGGGRTGTLWAHQQAGIAPDLVCAGKTLAGGVMPLAATFIAPHVAVQWQTDDPHKTFFHGHTFTAHPLACAVGVANWRLLAVGLETRVRDMEQFWRERLAELCDVPGVKDVRVRGVIAAVEIDVPGGYLAQVGRHMRQVCLQHDVLLRPLGNVLYTIPPLCTSSDSLEKIAIAMCAAVRAAASEKI